MPVQQQQGRARGLPAATSGLPLLSPTVLLSCRRRSFTWSTLSTAAIVVVVAVVYLSSSSNIASFSLSRANKSLKKHDD